MVGLGEPYSVRFPPVDSLRGRSGPGAAGGLWLMRETKSIPVSAGGVAVRLVSVVLCPRPDHPTGRAPRGSAPPRGSAGRSRRPRGSTHLAKQQAVGWQVERATRFGGCDPAVAPREPLHVGSKLRDCAGLAAVSSRSHRSNARGQRHPASTGALAARETCELNRRRRRSVTAGEARQRRRKGTYREPDETIARA